MLIQQTPADLGGHIRMLGTAAYPLYLACGPREGAIIEGGISAVGPLLTDQFRQLGIGPDYVRQAVITHAHPDHVMAIPLLRADVSGPDGPGLGPRGGGAWARRRRSTSSARSIVP